jgi:hypothetical protein
VGLVKLICSASLWFYPLDSKAPRGCILSLLD